MQLSNQFGPQRYALLFKPGTYGSASDPLSFQVGYGTEVAGLGASPHDVTVNGSINVFNQCDAGGCFALTNLWRSLSNLSVKRDRRDRLPVEHHVLGGLAGRADAPRRRHGQRVADGLLHTRAGASAATSSRTSSRRCTRAARSRRR